MRPRRDEVGSFATYEYLECRGFLRHAWKSEGTHVERTRPILWVQFSVCERCGTVREMGISAGGQVEYTKYKYPEGYRLPVLTKSEKRRLKVAALKRDMARPSKRLRKRLKAV